MVLISSNQKHAFHNQIFLWIKLTVPIKILCSYSFFSIFLKLLAFKSCSIHEVLSGQNLSFKSFFSWIRHNIRVIEMTSRNDYIIEPFCGSFRWCNFTSYWQISYFDLELFPRVVKFHAFNPFLELNKFFQMKVICECVDVIHDLLSFGEAGMIGMVLWVVFWQGKFGEFETLFGPICNQVVVHRGVNFNTLFFDPFFSAVFKEELFLTELRKKHL